MFEQVVDNTHRQTKPLSTWPWTVAKAQITYLQCLWFVFSALKLPNFLSFGCQEA
jgi:hypothetical protein